MTAVGNGVQGGTGCQLTVCPLLYVYARLHTRADCRHLGVCSRLHTLRQRIQPLWRMLILLHILADTAISCSRTSAEVLSPCQNCLMAGLSAGKSGQGCKVAHRHCPKRKQSPCRRLQGHDCDPQQWPQCWCPPGRRWPWALAVARTRSLSTLQHKRRVDVSSTAAAPLLGHTTQHLPQEHLRKHVCIRHDHC